MAHTLDYSIKVCSDTDFTDDDLDTDPINTKINDPNNINNNNNNNEEDLEYKIDSVNRLDSVENIQKVFYDKPKLNIPLDPLERDPEKRNNCVDEEGSSSNTGSYEDLEGNLQDVSDPDESNHEDGKIGAGETIIGDFGKEIEQEFGRIVERGIEKDLEEAVEKLSVATDLSPSALKYNIEPNTQEPFEKINSIDLLETVTAQEKVEVFLESSNQEVLEPLNIKQNAKDLPKPVTYFKEIDKPLKYVDIKLENQEVLIESSNLGEVEPLNFTLQTPQYPETVNIQPELSPIDEYENQEIPEPLLEEIKMKPEILPETTILVNKSPTNMEVVLPNAFHENMKVKITDALLSNAQDLIKNLEKDLFANQEKMDFEPVKDNRKEEMKIEMEKYSKEEKTKNDVEKDEDSMVPRKKEKMELNFVKKRRSPGQMMGSLVNIPRRDLGKNRDNIMNRRSLPPAREKKRASPEVLGNFYYPFLLIIFFYFFLN